MSARRTIQISLGTALIGFCAFALRGDQEARLAGPPEVRARNHSVSLTLRAVADPNGRNFFSFNGQTQPPTLRVSPGEELKITYINDLPAKPKESCAIPPCMDMTNLHFHGLSVSPNTPQDNVLDMMAMPGQSLSYTVQIPADHPPGLYWYHTHPHGESHRQVLDGMSGAIVVEGMDAYVSQLRGLRERVIVVRGLSIEDDASKGTLRRRVDVSHDGCGGEKEEAEEIFTVNNAVRPQIQIAPGERQFWRIVNASADRYLDLQVGGQSFEVVAMDGMPIAYHDPHQPTRVVDHVLLPPAGRLEAIVTGPAAGSRKSLSSRCVDTGSAGDPNPGMVLADMVPWSSKVSSPGIAASSRPAQYKPIDLSPEQQTPPQFVVTFTEDKHGFYINAQKYAPDADPMVRVKVGGYQHWRIVNATDELHPMHIHQAHFLAYAENGRPLPDQMWLDTVNVPSRGSVDVIMDFTNPVIKGMSVFHCHLLNHEDKGMMAKILFE